MPLVAIVMGSNSDTDYMQQTAEALDKLGVSYQTFAMSAHRTPAAVQQFAQSAAEQGFEVIIAGAGGAAHLPGVIASWTHLPVIGVPLPTSDLKGLDALLAIVQMPAGVPVATMAVGSAGARNAAYLAAEILALKHQDIRQAVLAHRQSQAEGKQP